MSHISTLSTAIISKLNIALDGKVNAIYQKAPLDAKAPFLIVRVVQARNNDTKATEGWHLELVIKVVSASRGSDEAAGLLGEIMAALKNKPQLPGYKITSLTQISSNISPMTNGWLGTAGFVVIMQPGFVADAREFVVKIGDGQAAETFTSIGGFKNAAISLQRNPLETTNLASNGVRSFMDKAGSVVMKIAGSGYYTGTEAESRLCALAFSGKINNYEIVMADNVFRGGLVVTGYKRGGGMGEEEVWVEWEGGDS